MEMIPLLADSKPAFCKETLVVLFVPCWPQVQKPGGGKEMQIFYLKKEFTYL